MNSLNTLYFPGTDIYSIRQYPLFLLFQKIHLIKPVEEDPADSSEESTDSFIKSGFCQVHTPCPLGENRQRFLHLVEDIRSRQDDYSAQLSSLVLAAKSAPTTKDTESEQSIMDSLRPPKDLQEKSLRAEKEEKLWQARLVLAIGEILDQKEEEIARNLAMLEDDQAELFKELHGDDDANEEDSPFAELNQVERILGAAHSGNIKKRFNGWKTLFLERDMPECEIFLTTSQDGGDLLLEKYEQRMQHPAPLIANLELPGLIGSNSGEAIETVVEFREKNSELLARIQKEFTDLVHNIKIIEQEAALKNSFAAISDDWNTQLELVFPIQQFGRIPVKCYLLPSLTCSALIGKKQTIDGDPKNGLLVIVD